MDISETLAPNSDQMDAVDLLGAARTFTISGVSRGSAEQPVNIDLAEFPRPWRPGKSMRRVLAACWGTDASAYVGRRVELLGGDAERAKPFMGGDFATIYLSPKDYHRVHMPLAGTLKEMVYVPGRLFSVNQTTAENVPELFARNERVVCVFEGEFGPFVLVLVGATIVGSMATVWHGVVNPPRPGTLRDWDYQAQNIHLHRGDEMGRFLLGSTVVLLMPQGDLQFTADWQATRPVRLGEAMAQQGYYV